MRHEYKLFVLRAPTDTSKEEVAAATEKKMLADLAALDEEGWQIEHAFPDGGHFLMKRERPDWPKWEPKKEDQQKTASGGAVEVDPKAKKEATS